ncbi:transglycosylase family protein [Pseudonocardia sp. KRD291]|uniref:transglycosylase family protein n=1 Tax=Pseudonocardia sp. KRD291 TaxID=2792007 RepID=UPI001C49CF69|nr:transglycosylase family protein [Pseudonocardia sp. KRD291]MBW0105113.1 transglycosylase family protein [Pseudonocardia sp. KRD291]
MSSSSRVSVTTRRVVGIAAAGLVAAGAPLALAGTANAAPSSTWDKLAECESGGDWSINTGNGFSGGLQFTPSTWKAFGGEGSPTNASRSEQIQVAEKVLDEQGWGAWPACSEKLGLS